MAPIQECLGGRLSSLDLRGFAAGKKLFTAFPFPPPCINTLQIAAALLSLTMGAAEVVPVNILEGLTVWSAVGAGALTLVYLFFLAVRDEEDYICDSASLKSSKL